MPHRPVSVSRVIAAPPEAVFAIVADPSRHPEIDGSGMLRASMDGPAPLQLGSTFTMRMRQFGMPYSMVNTVTELEPDRRIAWRPAAMVAGHKTAGGVTWRYEITPTDGGCTVVETYDITTGTGSRALALLRFPEKMARAMAATLDRLADVAQAEAEQSPTR
jgi:uncharacterized protein YndB with AHSA1/START domain